MNRSRLIYSKNLSRLRVHLTGQLIERERLPTMPETAILNRSPIGDDY
jgi:hypothetical protein